MPKYDDFGRPIYETAEEYNRAHKTAGSAYTQTTFTGNAQKQSATQRHAAREGMKKVQIYAVGMVAFFIAMICGLTFMAVNINGGRYEEAYPEPDYPYGVEEGIVEENLSAPDTPLPTGYENIIYNDVWITLPTTCKEIATLGYEIESYELTDIVPPDFWDNIGLLDENGYMVAMFSICNKTGEDISVGECMVEYFYIHNEKAYDKGLESPNFIFGEGYNFESTYEELESYLGTPHYHYSDYTDEEFLYDSYEWTYYGEEEEQRVIVNFVNDVISDVSIEKNRN